MILHLALIRIWLMWDASSFFEWLAARPWYTQILTDWVASIAIKPGQSGLEAGCGPGLLTAKVHEQGVTMTGLDRSPAMVKRARHNVPGCTFIEGDALALPLDSDVVDVSFAASVVNVVATPQKLVNEMARVVRTGGRVSVLFPTPRLSDDASMIGKRLNLDGLSAAALATWGGKAPKSEPETIKMVFTKAGLLDIRINLFFHDTVASVTGRVP